MKILFYLTALSGLTVLGWAIVVFVKEIKRSLANDRSPKHVDKQTISEKPALYIPNFEMEKDNEIRNISIEVSHMQYDIEFINSLARLLLSRLHGKYKNDITRNVYRDVNLPSIEERNISNPLKKERLTERLSNDFVNN
jgi:hypothetical protein